MKMILTLALTVMLSSGAAFAADNTDSIKVWGNCGMCKARIEKAAKDAGALSANWSEDTKTLSVVFKAEATSLQAIEQKVAAAGHDTQNTNAAKSAYSKLPGCCKYERKPGAE